MRNRALSTAIASLAALALQAQKYSARVVDGETGEPLPYVSIYRSKGHGTLTNEEGEFHINASKDDVLILSFIGYKKLEVKASALPGTIRMKPLDLVLKEVVVTPPDVEGILSEVILHLKKDFKAQRKTKRGYFVRHLLKSAEDTYLMEGFLTARSAVNLREEAFLSATGGRNAEGKESLIRLTGTNIHKLTEVGARTNQSPYWEETIKPLTSIKTIRKYYKADLETLTGENGEKLYRIKLSWTHKMTEALRNKRYITGTLFVNAENLHPLSFEGVVNNAYQRVDFFRRPTKISFYMSYDYTDGYAAVSHISVRGGNEMMSYRIILFNVADSDLPQEKQAAIGANTLEAIYKAGADPALWERYDIIKRTREEAEAIGKVIGE